MKVEVEGLKTESLLSEPPPPQYDSPPQAPRSLVRSQSEILPRSSPLPYNEAESSSDYQTESDYLGEPADGQFLGREGKVVPKCECPALKPPSVGTGMQGPRDPHLEMQ